ncbi:unnamed protein product [Penicillium camemberti]|uniref:Str. FM013 n=1 Tax=Penicillium camemberti (strain FM 013) TaxID=1429867 RepID=A0A0G4P0Y4_PENC3|nr:unnamed protein product [Penicillium camemberti]
MKGKICDHLQGVSRVQTELCVMGARQLTIGATLAVEMVYVP